MSPSAQRPHFVLLFLGVLVIVSPRAQAQSPGKVGKPFNNSVSAIFVFGDSTVDPGNNNFVRTIFKGNFLPYGRDFPGQVSTGRFTNGRLASDFIASYVGVKEFVAPYLDPTLSIEDLKTGVSFASAGSGFDPLTPQLSNVISLSKQLEYFKEYKKRVEMVIGKERTKRLIQNAVFLISAGTNDFVVNYFTVPIRRKTYTLPAYMDFLLQQFHHFMQALSEQGARRIGVAGLPPMGCLPIVITVNSNNAVQHRGCIDFFSSVAQQYNFILRKKLDDMQLSLSNSPGHRIVYLDIYQPLSDMIFQTQKFNFTEVNSGCCGTGLLETAFLCNPTSYVCSDASEYVFWDSIHPSERTYKLIFEAIQPSVDFLIKD